MTDSDKSPLIDQAFRRKGLYDSSPEVTFAGALSFMRRNYTRELSGVDVAVTGLPFDLATTFRPGARFGPAAVRAGSVQLAELLSFPFGFDPFERLAVIDYGDCRFDFDRPTEIPDRITDHIRTILKSDVKTLSIGGDHYLTYPVLKAYAEKFGPVSLVHFDAHSDTWDSDGEFMNHGTMFTRAVNENLVDPGRSVQVGLRTWNDEDRGFNILDAPWVHENGTAATIERIIEIIGDHQAYMTFDIDCLDPAFAPGTGTPVAGGLSSHQALTIIRGLGDIEWLGMDIVEVAPAYDSAEITAIAAATIAYDWLCLLAAKKSARSGG
jgi:agmatinase